MKYVRSLSSVSLCRNDKPYFVGAFFRMLEIEMNSKSQYPDRNMPQ